jgi:hypothetical protein
MKRKLARKLRRGTKGRKQISDEIKAKSFNRE